MDYFDRIREASAGTKVYSHGHEMPLDEGIAEACFMFGQVRAQRRRVIFAGNGGSMAAASHMANDLCLAGVPSLALDSGPNFSCAANDFGIEEAFRRQAEWLSSPDDTVVGLSCSGTSPNILSLIKWATRRKMATLTFSGAMKGDKNALAKAGSINFVVPSKSYGIVQLAHEAILHLIIDKIAGLEK